MRRASTMGRLCCGMEFHIMSRTLICVGICAVRIVITEKHNRCSARQQLTPSQFVACRQLKNSAGRFSGVSQSKMRFDSSKVQWEANTLNTKTTVNGELCLAQTLDRISPTCQCMDVQLVGQAQEETQGSHKQFSVDMAVCESGVAMGNSCPRITQWQHSV